ncbi:hypothetical protein DW091_06585 [Eubacterium sp. AM05-23]|nr:hypothetical protein DW091_06585 [Eubacterium sp. AM05-23]
MSIQTERESLKNSQVCTWIKAVDFKKPTSFTLIIQADILYKIFFYSAISKQKNHITIYTVI